VYNIGGISADLTNLLGKVVCLDSTNTGRFSSTDPSPPTEQSPHPSLQPALADGPATVVDSIYSAVPSVGSCAPNTGDSTTGLVEVDSMYSGSSNARAWTQAYMDDGTAIQTQGDSSEQLQGGVGSFTVNGGTVTAYAVPLQDGVGMGALVNLGSTTVIVSIYAPVQFSQIQAILNLLRAA
jgi:hypothetical protein